MTSTRVIHPPNQELYQAKTVRGIVHERFSAHIENYMQHLRDTLKNANVRCSKIYNINTMYC